MNPPYAYAERRLIAGFRGQGAPGFSAPADAVTVGSEAYPHSSITASFNVYRYPSPSGCCASIVATPGHFCATSITKAGWHLAFPLVSCGKHARIAASGRDKKQKGTLTCGNHSQSRSRQRPSGWQDVGTRMPNAASPARRSVRSVPPLSVRIRLSARPSVRRRACSATTLRRVPAAKDFAAPAALQHNEITRIPAVQPSGCAGLSRARTGRGTPCSRKS